MNLRKNLFFLSVCLLSHLLMNNYLAVAAEENTAAKPIRLHRTVTRLTTFAFSEDEIRRQMEKIFQQRPGRLAMVSGFGELPSRISHSSAAEQNRHSAIMLWEGQIALEEPADCEFAINQPALPWAIYLNGDYLAGWQSSKITDQEWTFTPARSLAAGKHTLQLVAVRKLTEEPPTLRLRKNGLPAEGGELTNLLPLPKHGLVEPTGAAKWERPRNFHFLATDQYLHCYTRIGKVEFLPATNAEGLHLTEAKQPLHYSLLPLWSLAETVFCRSQLSSVEVLLAAREELAFVHQMSWPFALPEAWKENWQLRCQLYDRAGRLLSDKVIRTGFQENLTLSLPLLPEYGKISLQACLFSVPIAKAVQIMIVGPANFSSELTVRGQSLWLKENLAVLRCDPLPKIKEMPAAVMPTAHSSKPLRLYLFDDARGDTHSAFDSPAFEQILQKQCSLNIGKIFLPDTSGQPTALRGIAALGKLLAMRPDLALLNLGTVELQSGSSPERYCQTLLFMSQVCLAANIKPYLLAWPQQPGIAASVARQCALLSKELGLALGIPVIDLYSAQIQENTSSDSWFQDDFAEHLAPNAEGQAWLASKIAAALRK